MKTILQKKSTKTALILFLFLLTGGLYLNSQAGNFTWIQNSWMGGQSGTTATHSTDANGTWTNYSAKDADLNINGSGDAELKKASDWQETTDSDFSTNTSKDSTLAVSGNSIKLLKADGAACSAAGDCQSNVCTGNICAFACGNSTISYGGKNYTTVQIGSQCWFKENLNVGTRIAGTAMPTDPAPTLNNPATVSKWCYSNDESNCTNEGGFYSWAEANALASACNTATCTPSVPNQGICPTGWHIPTDAEFKTLEMYLGMTQAQADATEWRGTDQGSKLSMLTLNGNNSSKFTALMTGDRITDGSFGYRGTNTDFSTASPSSTTAAMCRVLGSNYSSVYRTAFSKSYGFSVRCLKN